MKTLKKLSCFALILVLILAMAAPALAEGNGKITINNAVDGQIYTAYKIFDLESYNNEDNAFSYKLATDSPWAAFFQKADPENDTEAGPGAAYVSIDEQGYVTWEAAADTDTAQAFAKLALAYADAHSITGTSQTAANSKVEFGGLDLGYYLIDSSLGALCALDTTNNEVDMQEKNEKPTDDKTSQMPADSKVGSEISYTITINAKKGAQAYKVHDTMGAGLTFNPTSLTVTATPVVAEGETATTTTLVLNSDYTLAQNVPHHDNAEKPEEVTSTCTFELTFNQDYLNTLTGDTTILITYTATINANAVIGKDPITNEEILDYGDNNHTEHTPGNDTKDKFYDFDLAKTNSDNALLAGAVFQLQDKGGNVIKLVQKADGTYRPAVAEDEAAGSTVTVLEQIITNKDTKITFSGFAAGSYTLKELTAPSGYNVLKAPVAIQITPKMENGKVVLDSEGYKVMELVVDGENVGSLTATVSEEKTEGEGENATTTPATWTAGGVHIQNFTGAELPSTGGIGTTIFYIVGGLLVVGACVLLVTRKRADAE